MLLLDLSIYSSSLTILAAVRSFGAIVGLVFGQVSSLECSATVERTVHANALIFVTEMLLPLS